MVSLLSTMGEDLSQGAARTDAHTAAAAGGALRTVTRGLVALIASRLVKIPITIAINAALARRLGAGDFGAIYLASTGLAVAFLLVDFGTSAQAAAVVARDHASAPRILGAGLALRVVLGGALLAGLPAITRALGYDDVVRMVFVLVAVRLLIDSGASVLGSIVRGLEQITLHARLSVVTSVVEAAVLIPTLLLGGGLRAALLAQIAAAALGLFIWWVALARVGAAKMALHRDDVVLLVRGGFGFVAFDAALRMQPYLDANFLQKLGSPDAVGWYAAANRVVSALLIPASTLNFAIYPAMARLWATDREAYARLARTGLRLVILFGMPAAVGAVAFGDLAIAVVYGRNGFGPAATDLRILGGFVALVYLSMLLGVAIAAVGRQLAWAGIQALCVPVSIVLDPWLIPWFERRFGNGGLGVCIAVVAAEVLMVTGGFLLVPRSVLGRSLVADVARAIAGGALMLGAARLLNGIPALAVVVSLAAYFGAQALLGGLDSALLAQLRQSIASKFSPRATPAGGGEAT